MAMFSYGGETKASDYHHACVPADDRQLARETVDAGNTAASKAAQSTFDNVKGDMLWRQRVKNEALRTKEWKENWDFLTKVDPKGNEQPPPPDLPDKLNMFSDSISNTSSGLYGSRLNTEVGQRISNMQFGFQANKRRRKFGPEMICY